MRLFKSQQDRVESELRSLVGDYEVPHFPQATMRILHKLRDPEACFEDISDSLQWDPGLVVQVLKTVNSAAYGPTVRIEDVRHAISFMGRSPLEQLVLAIAVKNTLPTAPAPGFQKERFWQAAAFRAALGRALAQELHPARIGEAFTAGLLQDMAVPILAHAMPQRYGTVLERWHREGGARLADLELETLGWNHARVGALLGRLWELPANLVQAIEHHHSTTATDSELLPATRLAGLVRESWSDQEIEKLIEQALDDYGLLPDWTRETIESCAQKSQELAAMLTD